MFGMIIANIFGILLLFFFLWKRLKDDYHYEKIFNLAFLILFGLLIGFFLSISFAPKFWFWIELLSVSIFFFISIKRQRIKFFESLDGLIIGLLPLLAVNYLVDAVNKSSLSSFLAFWTVLISIFAFFFLDAQYRRFSWYKSGRVGFAGVATVILFFLIRIALYLIYPQTLSFVTPYDLYLSSTFAFSFFLVLYSLSRSKE